MILTIWSSWRRLGFLHFDKATFLLSSYGLYQRSHDVLLNLQVDKSLKVCRIQTVPRFLSCLPDKAFHQYSEMVKFIVLPRGDSIFVINWRFTSLEYTIELPCSCMCP